MARLNQQIRGAILRGIMADVPEIDYFEQINSIVRAWWETQMPLKVHALYVDKDLRRHLSTEAFSVFVQDGEDPDDGYYVPVGFLDGFVDRDILSQIMPHEIKQEILKLYVARLDQGKRREALQRSIRVKLRATHTTAGLLKEFPEFKKYVPKDETKTEHPVPATSNIMANLVIAGWKG